MAKRKREHNSFTPGPQPSGTHVTEQPAMPEFKCIPALAEKIAGVKDLKKQEDLPDTVLKILALYAVKVPYARIANMMGLSKSTIQDYIERYDPHRTLKFDPELGHLVMAEVYNHMENEATFSIKNSDLRKLPVAQRIRAISELNKLKRMHIEDAIKVAELREKGAKDVGPGSLAELSAKFDKPMEPVEGQATDAVSPQAQPPGSTGKIDIQEDG